MAIFRRDKKRDFQPISAFGMDVCYSVEYHQQFRPWTTVMARQRRPLFIAADGHAETPRISESSQDSSRVVNKLL